MRTRIVVAATAALLSLATTAYAANAGGTVESYDPEERLLTLDNSVSFMLSNRVQNVDINEGDQVQIIWQGYNKGVRVANRVMVSEPETSTTAAND
jgi:hypothetical protein